MTDTTQQSDQHTGKLHVVYAQYQRGEPFSFDLFKGFTKLRVLTYSASIPMTFKILNWFEEVECVFGYEGVLNNFSEILAFQKVVSENILMVVKGLEDERKRFILDKVKRGQARFFVVKNQIAHSKIYLLESNEKKRVIVGSANMSDQAFSGKQAETIVVFDNDNNAWNHYEIDYQTARQSANSEVCLVDPTRTEIALEDVPILQEMNGSKAGITVVVNTDPAINTVPVIIRKVEKLAEKYHPIVHPMVKAKSGKVHAGHDVVGKIIHLIKSQKREDQNQEPTWFSIQRDTQKVLLSGKEIPLTSDRSMVEQDVDCLIEYFENFQNGFHGDVEQHQKDYFMFMCWFYLAPFVCDFRNHAIIGQEYIFDYPVFAVLYGKSNCGKTRLIETLMKSMFGYSQFVDKEQFTRTKLRDLLYYSKRFPVVFDDVEKKRFVDHASDLIKDESFMLEEYPPFVLSMNAEDHSFSTEVRKRCLILYTRASLPDNTEMTKQLYKSVMSIKNRISTNLYREYLKRVLAHLADQGIPPDMLKFSSEILTTIFHEVHPARLPSWCSVVSIRDYQGRKYEKIRAELIKLYETNSAIWEVRRNEVILRVQQAESFGLRREIPDWLLKEGSKAGNIILDRKPLEAFLEMSFNRKWQRWFRR